MTYYIEDMHEIYLGSDTPMPGRWSYGYNETSGRFGGAHPNGVVNLHDWRGTGLHTKTVKCRSYRRAVRVLRQFLKGYTV